MTLRRFDRGTLRSAGFVTLLTVVFVVTNTAVAAAADGSSETGGLLAPLNVTSSEGVPLAGYSLEADGGSVTDITSQFQTLVLGGLFTLVRLLVGLSCWMIQFVFRFPLTKVLLAPAQKASEAYNTHVVGALGLKALLLGWAFIFGVILLMRGKVGKGLGEIVLTLVIAAFAASAFIRPDYILGTDGPLDQTHQASLEVAQITTGSYFGKTYDTSDPCDLIAGPAQATCQDSDVAAKAVSQPIQDALTNALVVKPYELLEYGRILNPKSADDKAAYYIHLAWVAGAYTESTVDPDNDPCSKIPGPAKAYCSSTGADKDNCGYLLGSAKDACENTSKDIGFDSFRDDLSKAGKVGKAAAEYAKTPSWDRVGGVLLLLIAVAVVALMVCTMAMVQLGTQGADVGAAAIGGIAWVWGMLPGPSRMAVWRWFGVFIVSVMVGFVAAAAIPLFGITVDVLLTSAGPDLMVERLLLLDGLAIAALAFHRRLMAATSQFGSRLALRMRYAKVGGTHLPGDTSELGAALAMNGFGGGGGGSAGLLGGPSGAHQAFGVRHRILGNLAAMADGTGMPADPGRLLGDALAEGRRGLAPLGLGLAGARLALRGAHSALIGPKPPEEDESVKLLRTIAKGVDGDGIPGGPGGHSRPGGPDGGKKVNTTTGEILHDPETHRPLLGSRIHDKASRLRGYRIASRAARIGYGATLGLPRNVQTGRRKASQFTEDAHIQLKVAANQVHQDAGEWKQVGAATMAPVDHVSQRVATAWNVHGAVPARNAAAGSGFFVSALTGVDVPDDPGPGSRHAAAQPAEGPQPAEDATRRQEAADHAARRRVLEVLMRTQREHGWDQRPKWGGGDDQ